MQRQTAADKAISAEALSEVRQSRSARISVFHGEIDVSIGSGCSGLFFQSLIIIIYLCSLSDCGPEEVNEGK